MSEQKLTPEAEVLLSNIPEIRQYVGRDKGARIALTNPDLLKAQGLYTKEWISVEDRLPENGQTVVLFNDGILLTFFKFWAAGANGTAFPYFADMNDRGPITLYEVTHWMPLPTPPKTGV